MTVIKPTRSDERANKSGEESPNPVANVEGEIREFVRKDVMGSRRPAGEADLGAGNLNFLIERVAGTSIREIDHLISELQAVRDYLRAEGERVQREIAGYAQASQAAMASAKIIAESMGQWKGTNPRPQEASVS